MSASTEFYSGRRVLVTGGFGFLGLNLISHLVASGALVRVLGHAAPSITSLGTSFLEGIEFLEGDIRDPKALRRALDGCAVVFNFAGRSGTVASNASPFEDLDTNVRGQLTFLQACSEAKTRLKVVFPSSRLVYKPTTYQPVNESAATGPISIYGVHKLTAENYHLLYHRLGRIDAVVLRITNPYGRFQRREQNRYGIINWFIHRALSGLDLPIYGLGTHIRDYVHVDDVVDAFLLAGRKPEASGMIFNIGSGKGVSFVHMAELVIRTAGTGRVRFLDWPPDAAGVETGDFVADVSLVGRVLGWRPRVTLDQGVEHVVAQYRALSHGEPATSGQTLSD
jgi:UDP-glucose 4-epimerase